MFQIQNAYVQLHVYMVFLYLYNLPPLHLDDFVHLISHFQIVHFCTPMHHIHSYNKNLLFLYKQFYRPMMKVVLYLVKNPRLNEHRMILTIVQLKHCNLLQEYPDNGH